MRAGVWWSAAAAALTLLALASALRTPQVEGVSRTGRRISAPSAPEAKLDSNGPEAVQPTFRPKSPGRQEETPPREVVRSRTRSRPVKAAASEAEAPQSRNEQFDSRRTYSRTRNRSIESDANKETTINREKVVRRTRPSSRRIAPTQAPIEASSPTIDVSKIEVINANLDDIAESTPKVDNIATTQFRRRSSTTTTVENVTRRSRGRINTRTNANPLDLAVSGTTNTLYREQTTSRNIKDLRNSRRLRYKTRSSETDSNLTGEGITVSNEVKKSSQNEDVITSQPETQTSLTTAKTTVQPSTEVNPVKTTTNKITKVIRRPLPRGKVNFRPSVSLKKVKSEEISEDDNYPESFKALLQAKNASTQTSSPPSESLSVKASQKVYKTYTSSAQSTNTGHSKNKYSRFRSKLNGEETKEGEGKVEDKPAETTPAPDQPKPRNPEYRPRGIYTPRNRKGTSFTPSTTVPSISTSRSTERQLYKFNRKFKVNTTSTDSPSAEITIKNKTRQDNFFQKSHNRPTYYSRRSPKYNNTSTEAPVLTSENEQNKNRYTNVTPNKSILPKTSYYSRFRNKGSHNDSSSTTEITIVANSEANQTTADKKNEDSASIPLVFSLLKKSSDGETNKSETHDNKNSEKEVFLITVTSTESEESKNNNEVANRGEETENQPIINSADTSIKYHSTYQGNGVKKELKNDEQVAPAVTPAIRNIQTRKYGRKRTKAKDDEDVAGVTHKPRERNLRKFSETFSKTTEPTTNGIPQETDKQKSRYSSKYRSSYQDKPFYKPTVPTITSSTAWLKFFVTDQQLAKYVEEPKWFEVQNIDDVTTQMSRQSVTPSSIIHESSIELVEGEEFQLGPDMNAISFTLPRSTLSSADLKLSESLLKPSHVMNLEASHSASVTVSIFDALAEILTSTPRTPRISSTTEVIQKLNNIDIKQTLNGVSNSINVNNVRDLASQDTLTSPNTDVKITTKSVQITDQTPPNVNNRLSVEESATPPLKAEEGNVTPVNTPSVPTPTPTTPVSARRPFAIKVLYSETESPTDKLMTATESTSYQPSTDSPATVFNTVSDLLISNNHLVSSELTSMLSNNILDIIQNMDENTRSKISGDMAKLLKSLIPRALNRLATVNDDVDFGLNTTPYSLEDIKDTENVNVDNRNVDTNIDVINSLQSVAMQRIVHSTTVDASAGIKENPTQTVNSSTVSPQMTNQSLSVSSSQTTTAASTVSLEQSSSSITLSTTTPLDKVATFSDSLDTDNISNSTNINIPIPFLTNFKIIDLTNNDSGSLDNDLSTTQNAPLPLITRSVTPSQNTYNIDIQDPNQISPLQLLVLSKKARVLKMIEDLIRQHNNELATISPLTEILDQKNSIPLSSRLTEIMNTMSSTTESNFENQGDSTSPTITPSFTPIPLSTISQTTQADTPTSNIDFGLFTTLTTTESMVSSNAVTSTNIQVAPEISLRFGSPDTTTTGVVSTAENTEVFSSTTPVATTVQETAEISNRAQEVTSTTIASDETIMTTTLENIETTTGLVDIETTQLNIDTTTITDVETTTQADVENITNTSGNETQQNIVSVSNRLNVDTPSIPKKDYVIFGILPNNTVVRKDPNDDILETLTEASPYIVYSVLPNNTVIRRFPNGTRVPRVIQKIDVLPISPWSLRNPYSPIHNNPAIVRPQSNPIRVSTNIVTSTDTNNGSENRLTNDTVNNLQTMIPSSALNIKDSSSLGVTTAINRLPAEKSTASHVLSLRTPTMLPSVDEILLNSLSSAAKEEMVISSMTSSTHEPRILTLDIDPETQQIRTERPSDKNGSAVFKFIPIDEVTTASQDTNVLKLASTKASSALNTGNTEVQTVTAVSFTEVNTQTPQIQTQNESTDTPTTTVQVTAGTTFETNPDVIFTNKPFTTSESTYPPTFTVPPTTTVIVTTLAPTTTTIEPITKSTTTEATTTTSAPTSTVQMTTVPITTVTSPPTFTTNAEEDRKFSEDVQFLQTLLQGAERNPKSLNTNQIPLDDVTTTAAPTTRVITTTQQSEEDKLLRAILAANIRPNTLSIPNIGGNIRVTTRTQTTTSRSIEDEIKQFEEDTKLLKALLAATGQNPASLNIPLLDGINIPTSISSPTITTTNKPKTTTNAPTTTVRVQTTTPTIDDDIKTFNEDTKLLQALLQATGQNTKNVDLPIITGVTSNVRIASNPLTTSIGSNPTTPMNIRPVYTSRTTTTPPSPVFTSAPSTIPVLTTLQPRVPITTEEAGISTTFAPKERRRLPNTTLRSVQATITGRRAPPSGFSMTTEIPSTSTFSDQEDLLFLQNLKSVLKTNPSNEDPEAGLANRIIALAVERSLNEIQSGQQADDGRTGKSIATTPINRIPPTTRTTTTTTTTTTTRPTTTTIKDNTPSIEDDIRQFQEDTKLLQALLKATGQDPSKFNIPTLPIVNANVKLSPASNGANDDLNLLSNLLASPSPLNEPFDSLTQKPNARLTAIRTTPDTTPKPFGAKIAVKDDLNNVQDDAKLLQTLLTLQGVQETTTQRSKLAITGQSPDEALQKLIEQTKPTGMVSEATRAPMSISTEFGKSNDALLAALLKEQGFGPTTASSLDEQLRLSALLNQVVVTPKARRTTTLPPPPPPPPAQRRPILDGLAWLWQQWRETAPGPGAPRPNRRPEASPNPAVSSSAATSNRVNSWFGSGPFVGNADDRPTSNRIPLEPPRAVAEEQTPGRGQLVSAAINVTRAFSQFLGAAIQGAAQTVQSVIRAGQRAATDVYNNGSG